MIVIILYLDAVESPPSKKVRRVSTRIKDEFDEIGSVLSLPSETTNSFPMRMRDHHPRRSSDNDIKSGYSFLSHEVSWREPRIGECYQAIIDVEFSGETNLLSNISTQNLQNLHIQTDILDITKKPAYKRGEIMTLLSCTDGISGKPLKQKLCCIVMSSESTPSSQSFFQVQICNSNE